MTDPTFTLEHDEQRYRVQLGDHNGKTYAVYLTIYGNGMVTIIPYSSVLDEKRFKFQQSSPHAVLMVGKLLIAAAKKAGAVDE